MRARATSVCMNTHDNLKGSLVPARCEGELETEGMSERPQNPRVGVSNARNV